MVVVFPEMFKIKTVKQEETVLPTMDEIQASCIYWLHFKVTFAFQTQVFARVKFF